MDMLDRIVRLSFIQDGQFKNKREIEGAVRLMKVLLSRYELPQVAGIINDLSLLSRGNGNVFDLPRELLKKMDNFKGWGSEDFDILYKELTKQKEVKERMLVMSSVKEVFERIRKTPLPMTQKKEMMTRPEKLSLSESRELYKDVNFGTQKRLQNSFGRSCRVRWTDHAEYRSELRDIDPEALSSQVCQYIDDRYFNKNNPRRERPDRDNLRVKVPEGVAVVEYDARKDPIPVSVVTTWASARNR